MCCHTINTSEKLLLGVQFDKPAVFMPWYTKEDEVLKLFQNNDIKRIGENGYLMNYPAARLRGIREKLNFTRIS